MVVIRPISVLCGSQDENGVIPSELSMVSPPSTLWVILSEQATI